VGFSGDSCVIQDRLRWFVRRGDKGEVVCVVVVLLLSGVVVDFRGVDDDDICDMLMVGLVEKEADSVKSVDTVMEVRLRGMLLFLNVDFSKCCDNVIANVARRRWRFFLRRLRRCH